MISFAKRLRRNAVTKRAANWYTSTLNLHANFRNSYKLMFAMDPYICHIQLAMKVHKWLVASLTVYLHTGQYVGRPGIEAKYT